MFSIYDETATAAKFLLGGIGTGNISIGSRGNLCDFEIFNKPQKGFNAPYNFFTIRTCSVSSETDSDYSQQVQTRVLEAQLQPPYDHSHGFVAWEAGGLPRFTHTEMSAAYPFAQIKFIDEVMPVGVKLEAFTPFIPLNTDDSSLPCAIFTYEVSNLSEHPLMVSLAASMPNLTNYKECDIWNKPLFRDDGKNTYVNGKGFRGIHYTQSSLKQSQLDYMEMGLFSTDEQGFYTEYWNEGQWWDGVQDFWNDFVDDGWLDSNQHLQQDKFSMHISPFKISSLGSRKYLEVGETVSFRFIISWYRPNRIRSWNQFNTSDCKISKPELIHNYYNKFGNPLDVVTYVLAKYSHLEGLSRSFQQAVYSSTLPTYVIEAMANNITVIRSTTCFMVEGGKFFAFEGCFDSAGCCHGNCTHVWNYAQTLAYLFPDLERSMRKTEFLEETDDKGSMHFRAQKFLEGDVFNLPPATDGQLGTIIRCYREWILSGDDELIKELWPKICIALDFAGTNWDTDEDGILDSKQHNTYDIEFYGPNTLTNAIYYAALESAARIADYLGDTARASTYRELRMKGSQKLDNLCFNGEYYEQAIPDVNSHKYQYGSGCLSDQLFGQFLAHVCNLGYVFPEQHVKTALLSIYRYNYQENFHEFANMQRTYALNDESGLVLCTWPHGQRPRIPFVYSDEVWTGIEYHVAAHLIYEGFIDEGLSLVESTRARHDGMKRNPWNEVECGHHYARSLASYGIWTALTGFSCDLPKGKISFSPKVQKEDFSAFFSCGRGWGIYHQKRNPKNGEIDKHVEILYGDLSGIDLDGATSKKGKVF